jgi:hypothetical protein
MLGTERVDVAGGQLELVAADAARGVPVPPKLNVVATSAPMSAWNTSTRTPGEGPPQQEVSPQTVVIVGTSAASSRVGWPADTATSVAVLHESPSCHQWTAENSTR